MNTETKIEAARALLERLFATYHRVAIADAVSAASEIGVSRRTLQRACAELGVKEVHNGPFGGFWEKDK
jgi:N-formylglutamate amidohydrolase